MNRPFLIISHHRSGSNFLNELIQQHPKISTINEPLSMHTEFFRENDLILWNENDYHSNYFHPTLQNKPQLLDFLSELRDWLLHPYESYTRGVKETLLFDKLEWLKPFLPSLKIIFLIRDPRAVVNSVIRRNMHDSIWKYSKTIPRYLKRYHPQLADKVKNLSELSVYSWKIRYQLAIKYCHLFDHIFIKLEDLMLHPQKSLERIMKFLDGEVNQNQITFFYESHVMTNKNIFSSFRKTDEVLNLWKQVLPNELKEYIESTLYREMEELNYL